MITLSTHPHEALHFSCCHRIPRFTSKYCHGSGVRNMWWSRMEWRNGVRSRTSLLLLEYIREQMHNVFTRSPQSLQAQWAIPLVPTQPHIRRILRSSLPQPPPTQPVRLPQRSRLSPLKRTTENMLVSQHIIALPQTFHLYTLLYTVSPSMSLDPCELAE